MKSSSKRAPFSRSAPRCTLRFAIWSIDKRQCAKNRRHAPRPGTHVLKGRVWQITDSGVKSQVANLQRRRAPRPQRSARANAARIAVDPCRNLCALGDLCLFVGQVVPDRRAPLVGFLLGQAGFVPPNNALLYGGIAGGFGIILPRFWLAHRKAKRQALLSRSLPDMLDLMVTCVQSGLSMEAALQRVTDEIEVAHPPLAREMAIVQRQIELGTTPDAAIRNFAERSDLACLFSLSSLVEQARKFGTSLTDALRTQADMMRYQREQRAEELAQKAAVKILFPTLLFIFPAIFVVLVGPAAMRLSEIFSSRTEISSPHK